MIDILKNRLKQGYRTSDFPDGDPGLPERFRGRPLIRRELCAAGCAACIDACPTSALETRQADAKEGGQRDFLALDLGRCLFCAECTAACPEGAVAFTKDHRLAASRREDLLVTGDEAKLADSLGAEMRRLFGRSLKLRQVSAGGCSACEAELAALGNVVFDLGRFGIQFVASPRHADGLVITGPVTRNMSQALRIAYEAVPPPRLVIAVGACGISGGPFVGSEDHLGGAAAVVPVDLFIPGCPPHPVTILDGLLRLLGRL
ncbi:MAG: 4Fe-4S dicluster domain-containing protein [Elusimicrobia bacterium]|nr:4Fe-4S dicluster domain-containing protein [Elusimicrobiota bacterium]